MSHSRRLASQQKRWTPKFPGRPAMPLTSPEERGPCSCHFSHVAHGRLPALTLRDAEKAPGFLAILHHGNAPRCIARQ